MTSKTINVPFRVTVNSDGHGFNYVDDSRLSISGYGNGSAISKMRDDLIRVVNDGLDALNNTKARILASRNGEVFVVRWINGSWGYSISRSGSSSSSGSIGYPDYQSAYDAAGRHISSTFGGVVWEAWL